MFHDVSVLYCKAVKYVYESDSVSTELGSSGATRNASLSSRSSSGWYSWLVKQKHAPLAVEQILMKPPAEQITHLNAVVMD